MASKIERLWQGHGLGSRLLLKPLSPLAWGMRGALAIRHRLTAVRRVERPVISVGNLTVGGNGKTPLVLYLCHRLSAMGLRPVVVSRGYGRQQAGNMLAWSPGDPPADPSIFGDEPTWFTRRNPKVPVVVGADRVAACRWAIDELKAEVLVLDDAFQHIRLARDLDLVAVHAKAGLGNKQLLPAGPLREPPSALGRAHGLIFTYAEPDQQAGDLRRQHALPEQLPAAACKLLPVGFSTGLALKPREFSHIDRLWGLCGIARPDGFVDTTLNAGFKLLGMDTWPDHAPFSMRRFEKVLQRARRAGAEAILTTEKDLIKWPEAVQESISVLALRMELSWLGDGDRIMDDLLARAIAR